MTKKDIFADRAVIKPYEYPEMIQFADAIQTTFWSIHEFRKRVDKDIVDFKVNLSANERRIVKRSMLAISLVENRVKNF